MNILMFTNTFTPHVGGVAQSVQQFVRQYEKLGHRTLVVAPMFESALESKDGVIRVPAVQKFNGSDFSVAVPTLGFLTNAIADFSPDIVHSHHPFLLGDTAQRVAARYDIPVVFTHHTQYEKYTHYVPGDCGAMRQFVIDLAVGYCNMCDAVIAPSETIRQRLVQQGVQSTILEIPTGVETEVFSNGDGLAFRNEHGIGRSDFVVGHVGRLAPEKGLNFLADAAATFIADHESAKFLVAGSGPSSATVSEAFRSRGIADRLITVGHLERRELANLYKAMDIFAFASHSETQGMVLTEAMAASTPVVAVDAPGVREVLCDSKNGFMISDDNRSQFVRALERYYTMSNEDRQHLIHGALRTADEFSMPKMAKRTIELYAKLIGIGRSGPAHGHDLWSTARRRIEEEWNLWTNVGRAAANALLHCD
ncbi:MAG: glycosyltransferase [Planctomycetales bacterium]|nr:glycosyltransferase [Planctomycetales bacterium]